MVRIGFVSEQKTRSKKIFRREFTKEIVSKPTNPFEIIAIALPFSKEELLARRQKKQQKVSERALNLLREEGVERIFFSHELGEMLKTLSPGYVPETKKSRKLFFSWAYRCVKRITVTCGIKLLDAKVCIRTNKLDRLSENLMMQLCYDVKTLFLCTPRCDASDGVCRRFFEETGMCVRASESLAGDEDIVIDVECMEVRVGRDAVIDGAAPELDVGGFEIHLPELAACIFEEFDTNEKLSFFSGKKKLTL